MKDFAGTPGTITGFVLRIAQFMFAAGSIASMATTSSFYNFTAFWYFIHFFQLSNSFLSCCLLHPLSGYNWLLIQITLSTWYMIINGGLVDYIFYSVFSV